MSWRALFRSILGRLAPWWKGIHPKGDEMASASQDILNELLATPPHRTVQHINSESQDVTEFHDVTFQQDYIVLDVETTGFNINKCRIIQLAMIKVRQDGSVDTFSKYFNPCVSRESQLTAYKVHQISPDVLLRKKAFKYHCDDVIDFLVGVKYLIGHNILFDWNFLEKELRQASGGTLPELLDGDNIVLIDTYKSSLLTFSNLPSYSLGRVAKHLKVEASRQPVMKYRLTSPSKNKKELIEVTEKADESLHDALTDTMITKEVFGACVEKLVAEWNSLCLNSFAESHPELTYPIKYVYLMDKLRQRNTTTTEKEQLKTFSETFMITVGSNRGKQLKDVPKVQICNTIQWYDNSGRNQVNDLRARALMDFYVSCDEMIVDEVGENEENGFGSSDQIKKRKDTTMDDFFQQKKPRIEEEAKHVQGVEVIEEEMRTPIE